MKEKPRVCIVLCKQVGSSYRFAVLKRTLNWEGWELIKGHIDADEPAEQAAIREIREEAGINEEDINRIEPVDHTLEWTYEEDEETVKAVCDCFLAIVDEDVFISVDQNPEEEHEKGHFLNFRDARDILTYDDQKELLKLVKQEYL